MDSELNATSVLEKIVNGIEKNKTALIGFVVLIVVLAGSYYVYDHYQASREEKALGQYFVAEKSYEDALNRGTEKSNPPDQKPNPANFESAEKQLSEVIEDYPKTKAAIQSALLLATIYEDQNNLAKSADTLEKVFDQSYRGELFDTLLALRLSSIYEKSKKCDKALLILEKISKGKMTEFRPEALLREGLCHESLGNLDKARKIYQELSTEYSDTNQGRQAQKYLYLIMDNNS